MSGGLGCREADWDGWDAQKIRRGNYSRKSPQRGRLPGNRTGRWQKDEREKDGKLGKEINRRKRERLPLRIDLPLT